LQFDNHQYYNCLVTTDDNRKFRMEANWLHNQELDRWQGWLCDAGHNRLYIGPDFDIYGGECCNDQLGNLETGWELLPTQTVCTKTRCTGCTDDLMAAKHLKEST
jgi:hypothetical protein